jgi:N4-gp56 family major capsid protein
MANSYIDIASQAIVIATMIDNMTVKPLRGNYIFDGVAKQKQWNLNSTPVKGDTVEFPVLAAFSANTSALDPTATTLGSKKTVYTRKSCAIDAYGDHSTIDTLEYRPETFVDITSDVAWSLLDQGMNSVNKLARNVLDLNRFTNEASGTISGTYHYYGSNGTFSSMGPLRARDVREIVADLKSDNVSPYADGYYIAIVTPAQSTQLRSETGNAAWGGAAVAGDASVQRVWAGDIGTYEGCRFIVNTENYTLTDTSHAYFVGSDSLGKAIGKDLAVKMKPSLDGPHANLLTLSWSAIIGYKVIRREGVRIVSTTTTTA